MSAEGATYVGKSGGILPRENFENWNPEMPTPAI